jgi:hypothetical protein
MILTRVTKRKLIERTDLIAHYLPGVGQTSGSTATWTDQSEWTLSDVSLFQNTAARVPSIVSVNGYDAFSFVNESTAANDDILRSLATGYSYLNGRSGSTVFCVMQFDSAQTADGGIFGVQNGASFYTTCFNLVMIASGGTLYPALQYKRVQTDATIRVESTVGMTNGAIYSLIGRVNFANGSQAFNILVNGTETTGTTPTGATYQFGCVNESPVAGAVAHTATNPLVPSTVKILECGVYGVYLPDDRRIALNAYLSQKFGT